MPKVDIAKLKPGSDAAESARQAWSVARKAVNAIDLYADSEGFDLAMARAEKAREAYNDRCNDLASDVYYLLLWANR